MNTWITLRMTKVIQTTAFSSLGWLCLCWRKKKNTVHVTKWFSNKVKYILSFSCISGNLNCICILLTPLLGTHEQRRISLYSRFDIFEAFADMPVTDVPHIGRLFCRRSEVNAGRNRVTLSHGKISCHVGKPVAGSIATHCRPPQVICYAGQIVFIDKLFCHNLIQPNLFQHT